MIWFVILTTVMANGDVYTEVRPANTPEYNNEQSCNQVGAMLVEQEQMKVGTNTGKVYYVCHSISKTSFDKATSKPGQDT